MGKSSKAVALETRERILDTAEQLFERRGVSRTSLEDIATAAGVTRGAIYGHFKGKSDLFVAMYRRVRPHIDQMYRPHPEDQVDPLGKLRTMLLTSFASVATKKQDQRVLAIMMHKCELTEDLEDFVSSSRQVWQSDSRRRLSLFRFAIKQGQLPKDLDVARAEIAFRGYMLGIISNWTMAPRSFNLKKQAEPLVDAYLDMLRQSPAMRKGTPHT
jgi:TetR/AcrR family transcriptional regulator, acrAB operon repressor